MKVGVPVTPSARASLMFLSILSLRAGSSMSARIRSTSTPASRDLDNGALRQPALGLHQGVVERIRVSWNASGCRGTPYRAPGSDDGRRAPPAPRSGTTRRELEIPCRRSGRRDFPSSSSRRHDSKGSYNARARHPGLRTTSRSSKSPGSVRGAGLSPAPARCFCVRPRLRDHHRDRVH
jgi:hypothetical protein